MRVAAETAWARGSSGNRSTRSDRSTAVHDGSSPMIGMPFTAYGPSTDSRFSRRLRAPSSWPVLIHVRPQHACSSGTTTSYPAAVSTVTAACGTPATCCR